MSDLRYALRTLRASPGLTLTATLTLGLGIGATTTIFTWADALVLHPFPLVHEPARLVWVRLRGPRGALENVVSYPDYLDWSEQARSFEGGLVATRIDAFGLRQPGQGSQAERGWGMLVSANYFAVLGVRPPPRPGRGARAGARPVAGDQSADRSSTRGSRGPGALGHVVHGRRDSGDVRLAALGPAWHDGRRAAHRLRKPRQPAAGAGRGARARPW